MTILLVIKILNANCENNRKRILKVYKHVRNM